MKKSCISILAIGLAISFTYSDCFSNPFTKAKGSQDNPVLVTDEIIFYSNGSTFSPVIVLQAEAEVLWTWEDNTTSNSLTPTKNYGSSQLRQNRLKVTPWSAIRRINIGYTAEDGGSGSIELVPDQHVSLVENISLVAPYLKEWCSSYNEIKSLDFSNFINIETIECYLSISLNEVNLTNTPKLKRACFEDNNLLSLNLSGCNSLEDLRGALNDYNTITFPTQKDNIWHICVRDNLQITDQELVNNLGPLPKIAEIIIGNSNQKGVLRISQTNPNRSVAIHAEANHYSSIDFRGSFINVNAGGIIYLQYNKLTTVDISGCIQIKKIDLRYNLLTSEAIDQILKQVDDYGTSNGTIDLSFNQPPTFIGLEYIANLKNRGWTVNTDPNIPIESISVSSASGTSITTDNGITQLSATIFPANATTQSVTWSTIVITGKASISTSGLLTAEKDGTVKAIATASDGSGVKGELLINISNQIIPVESILVTSPESTAITTDNGTIQLSASVLPTDATNKSITWSVINLTGKASISASGLLTAEKDGTVKAIATATDGSGMKGELTITISNQVIPVETILVSSSSGNLITTDNGTIQLQASILPTDATTKTVTWSVVDLTGKASINTSGLLTAINDGTVKAIATANDGSGIKSELTISISNQVILIENLTIIDDLINDTIKGIGTKLKLKVVVTPQNATNISVIWNVENITGQANIDQNGELTTISSGKINVIVEALDGSNRSDKKEYTIAIPVLLQQHNYLENIRIFPNPTSGKIKIHFEKLPSDGVEIEIRNPLGQTFIRKQIYENISEWQLEKYPFSIYFVTITDKDKSTTHKIINGIAPK